MCESWQMFMLQFLTELQINCKLSLFTFYCQRSFLTHIWCLMSFYSLLHQLFFWLQISVCMNNRRWLWVCWRICGTREHKPHTFFTWRASRSHMYHPAWEHSSVPSQFCSFSIFLMRLQLFLILLSVMLDALELYDYSCVCVCSNHMFPSGSIPGEVDPLLKSLAKVCCSAALGSLHSFLRRWSLGAVKHLIDGWNRKLFSFLPLGFPYRDADSVVR